MTVFKWDSSQYMKFGRERTQPSLDLAARLCASAPERVLDIGCGPGNSTAVLRERWPGAELLGIDSSREMIAAAQASGIDAEFEVCSVPDGIDRLGKFDVVFSNACLQWIPDHPALLPRLFGLVREGGELAVQIPFNYGEPIHRIIIDTAAGDEWREKIGTPRSYMMLTLPEYFDILAAMTDDFDIWTTVYCHRMRSHDDILEWYRGTGLRPYLNMLDTEDAARFEGEVLDGIRKAYPARDGGVIFSFPRLFFTARK